MTEALAALDGFMVAAILVKAAMYLASLLAAGSALFAILLVADGPARRLAYGLALAAGLAAIALTAALVAMRAAFLGGGTFAAARDPVLLSIVMDSPLGTSALVRAAGLVLVGAIVLPGRVGTALAAAGAVLVAASFALVGHTLAEPRALLGFLLAAHVLAAAFWVGAFAPLHALAGRGSPAVAGEVAHRFGAIAMPVVAGLLAAGLVLALLIAGGVAGLLTTAYGQLLLAKVAVVALLLALAAFNKLRLTPALLSGSAEAAAALRRSIRWEGAAVAAILVLTATFTTATAPADGGAAGDVDQRTAHLDTLRSTGGAEPSSGREPRHDGN